MKKLILMSYLFIVNFAVAGEKIDWIAAEYNANIQTSENLIYYIGRTNTAQAETLKKFLKESNVSSSDQVPKLIAHENYLTFAGDAQSAFKIIPSKEGGFDITYKKKKVYFKSTLTIDETKLLIKNLSSNDKISFSNFFISEAYADGGLEAAGMTWSAFTSTVELVALYGTAYVVDTAKGIASIPKKRSEQKLREEVMDSCDEIIDGKKVKDATKLRLKLEKLKSEDECVEGWPASMYHSCKWYEYHLKCLAQGSPEISDSKRESKRPVDKTPVESKPNKTLNK